MDEVIANSTDTLKDDIKKRVNKLKEDISDDFAYTAPEMLKWKIQTRIDMAFGDLIE